MTYVHASTAAEFIATLADQSVALVLTDPPYYDIVDEDWDNQWTDEPAYVQWIVDHFVAMYPKMTPTGSLLFFGGVGKHGSHPLFKVIDKLEATGLYTYRNFITWKKRRAYGKSHDYLFTREEIVWFSVAPGRTDVTFNIPLLDVKRGYAGFDKDHPAKSEFKRVSNVFDDINELFKTEWRCQKPVPLMRRFVATHSQPDDLVVDLFAGWGTTGVAALGLGRKFAGCEVNAAEAANADARCVAVAGR